MTAPARQNRQCPPGTSSSRSQADPHTEIELENLRNPKLVPDAARWYPYYAGYDETFVEGLLAAIRPSRRARILDPWNGSGSTLAVAQRLGLPAHGTDLNPALVIISRARGLSPAVATSLSPLGSEITEAARRLRHQPDDSEPLSRWFAAPAAAYLRRVDLAIRKVLLPPSPELRHGAVPTAAVSPLAAFYYTALFMTVRQHVQSFRSSNPTWIRVARSPSERISPHPAALARAFRAAVRSLVERMPPSSSPNPAERLRPAHSVSVADSRSLPFPPGYFDIVLTSPPYCTRIDYAVATLPELACLSLDAASVMHLRATLLGRPSFAPSIVPPLARAHTYTASILRKVQRHPSKASSSYYYRFFFTYFSELSESLAEIVRVARRTARIALVVQDSHYKDIHVDLCAVVSEMMATHGWYAKTKSFPVERTMAKLNPRSRRTPSDAPVLETVLVFTRG